DLHAAVGGAQQRPPDHLAGLVVAPLEATHQDRALRLVDPLQDAREGRLAAREQVEARARLGAFDGKAAQRHRVRQCNLARRAPQPTRRTSAATYLALTSPAHWR